jgi:uncharacterized protein YggT (Ycf19 family)
MDNDTHLWILRLAKGIVAFVYAVVTLCLVLLALGFVLQLFGASTTADFTEWVYRSVDRIMEPFRGMFPSRELSEGSIVDFSLLFAMIVYSIVAIALHALVSWLADRVAGVRRDRQRAQQAALAQPSPVGPQAAYREDPYGNRGGPPYGTASPRA